MAKGKKIVVGLSGGVDSAVAAALLVEQGQRVLGVFMKNWTAAVGETCPWREDRRAAIRVAAALGIPFQTWDFEAEYNERVMEYFFTEYAKGYTPNPDILCNREIKFAAFLDRARAEGAEGIATGHYAAIRSGARGPELHIPKDREKDQTYFLSQISQRALNHVVFPLANMSKRDVRAFARARNIPSADRPDSQGICFVGEVPIRDFLKTRLQPKPGKILNMRGEVIGTHDGLPFYTLGQRRGLNVAQDTVPHYVVAKDRVSNTLTVAQGNTAAELYTTRATATSVRWFGTQPEQGAALTARVRYRQHPTPCRFEAVGDDVFAVRFAVPQRAVTPGQFLVLYDGTRLVGSGILRDL